MKRLIMKKSLLVCMSLFALAGAASAQNAPLEGISESTDPAKIADVERRAQAMSQQGQPSGASGSAATGASSDRATGRPHKAKRDRMQRRIHKPRAPGSGAPGPAGNR